MGFSTIGMILYFLYPLSLIAISIFVSRNKEMTLENYFLTNRNTHWLVLGISLLTTSLFSPYLFGIAAISITSYSPVYILYFTIILLVLGWFFVPAFLKTSINTFPEYFENRFGKKFRLSLSSLYILSNVFIRMLIILVIGNALIKTIAGIDAYSSILFFLVISGLCVIIGGLKAEIYTNLIQLLIVTVVIAGCAGWLITKNSVAGFAVNKGVQLFNFDTVTNSGLTTSSLILGLPIIGFGFWCADQFIVHKVISVGNIKAARKAVVTTGILQLVPILIFAVIILTVNFSPNFSADGTLYNWFTDDSLPDSLRGGLLVAAASILMASFASLFNSTSALITFDFYKHFRSESSDRKLVLVGRMSTMILLFIAIVLLPLTQVTDFNFCLKLFKLFSYMISTVAAIFLASIFYKNLKPAAAFLSLCIVITLVVFQLVMEFIFSGQNNNNLTFSWFVNPGYLEFTILVFILSIVLSLILSLQPVSRVINVCRNVNLKVLLKLQYEWNAHRAVFLILSALIMIAIVGIILI